MLLGWGGRKKDGLSFFSISGGFPGMRKWQCIWKLVSSHCPCLSTGQMLWPPGRSCCVTGKSWDDKSHWDWKINKTKMRLKWQDNILRFFISFFSSPPTYYSSLRFSNKSDGFCPLQPRSPDITFSISDDLIAVSRANDNCLRIHKFLLESFSCHSASWKSNHVSEAAQGSQTYHSFHFVTES